MYYRRDRATHISRVAVNNARYRARNRNFAREILAKATCNDCSISDFAVLEFNHRDDALCARTAIDVAPRCVATGANS